VNASSPHRRAVASALAAIALWGSLAALGLRLKHVPPFLLVGCALLLGGLVGARGITLRATRPRLVLLGVYGLFAYHFCLFVALRLAPPVEANLVNYLWPLLIVVLSPLFVPGTRLAPRHVGGALLGFAGAALLVTGGRLGFSGSPAGYALALAAAVIWSTYSLLTRRLGGFRTSAISTFCVVSGALSLLCHAAFEPRYHPALADLPWLLAIGIGPMGAAFYLWDRALKDGDPRVVGTLSYLTPLLSTALIAALGEGRVGASAAVAGAMIVGGALLGSAPGRRADAAVPAPAAAAQSVEQSIEKR
jgi:drug/metabolite transporter (DMT)-like permease